MLEIHKNRAPAAASAPQKFPHPCTGGGSSLDLLNPSLIDGGNYKTLSVVFTHLLALFTFRREQCSTYFSTLIGKS